MLYAIFAAAGLLAGIIIMFIIVAMIQAINKRRRAARRATTLPTATEPPKSKRKMEFSKILAVWAAAVATAMLIASIVLAAYDKQALVELSMTVFTACIGYLVTYAGKSSFEKHSRNKHGIDADGRPFEIHDEETDSHFEDMKG